jgi:hypothetical protein
MIMNVATSLLEVQLLKMELAANVSEIVSASIIRGQGEG